MLKKISEFWVSLLFMLFLMAGLAFYIAELSTVKDVVNKAEKHLLAIVIMLTSLITGSFVIVRLYINNLINIKEKEMSKEFRDYFKEIAKTQQKQINARFDQQNARFEQQDARIDKKFADQLENIREIIKDQKTRNETL